jgi:hypothetical protein
MASSGGEGDPAVVVAVVDVSAMDLRRWDLGMYQLHEQDGKLRQALTLMALDLGLPAFLQVSENKLRTLFQRVEGLMHARPYHNFTHICDVTQVR